MAGRMLAFVLLGAAMVAASGTTAAASLAPRAHVMSTHLKSAATYSAIADESDLGLRLVVKFADGLAIRSSPTAAHGATHAEGVTSTIETSRPHAMDINRTLAAHGATVRPVLAEVGPEWEELVARAERLSGREQPDLRAMMQVDVGADASATELVAMGEALSMLPSVEFAEIEFTGMPPPGSSWKQNMSKPDLLRDCPVPPPKRNATVSSNGPTPDFTSLQRYSRGPEVGGFDADVSMRTTWQREHRQPAPLAACTSPCSLRCDCIAAPALADFRLGAGCRTLQWAAAQGADGAGVRYSDCEYLLRRMTLLTTDSSALDICIVSATDQGHHQVLLDLGPRRRTSFVRECCQKECRAFVKIRSFSQAAIRRVLRR
eukprot:COSAG02_NODE_5497_length_4280_cov_7.072232_2_plen_375_part_00